MVKRGPIHYRDGNQTEHSAEFVHVEKKFYPYRDAVSILDEWFSAHSNEQGLRDKLPVSGLSSALKAEKRAELAQKLARIVDVRVETELKIGRLTKGNHWGTIYDCVGSVKRHVDCARREGSFFSFYLKESFL